VLSPHSFSNSHTLPPPPQELHRFASSSGGVFPFPQHCSALQAVFLPTPTPTTSAGELGTLIKEGEGAGGEGAVGAEGAGGSAVVLLGDCIHAFPPDLGQVHSMHSTHSAHAHDKQRHEREQCTYLQLQTKCL
jgi:hypothetical protein